VRTAGDKGILLTCCEPVPRPTLAPRARQPRDGTTGHAVANRRMPVQPPSFGSCFLPRALNELHPTAAAERNNCAKNLEGEYESSLQKNRPIRRWGRIRAGPLDRGNIPSLISTTLGHLRLHHYAMHQPIAVGLWLPREYIGDNYSSR